MENKVICEMAKSRHCSNKWCEHWGKHEVKFFRMPVEEECTDMFYCAVRQQYVKCVPIDEK